MSSRLDITICFYTIKSMILLFISFVAGLLTVLAPCVLPILPVIIGSSVSGGVNRRRAYTVTASLGISVVLFTLLLKVSTVFIYIQPSVWEWISGSILIVFGVLSIFPGLWESLPGVNAMSRNSNKLMSSGYQKQSFTGDVIMGAALGPVFASCSPTYFVILATVLPASFGMGLLDLSAYALGLVLILLLVAFIGQRVVDKLGIASDPRGWFKRSVGVLLVVVGILVFTGYLKTIEAWVLSNVFDVTTIEQKLLHSTGS